eukprot:s1517_g13.t1
MAGNRCNAKCMHKRSWISPHGMGNSLLYQALRNRNSAAHAESVKFDREPGSSSDTCAKASEILSNSYLKLLAEWGGYII